MNDVHRSETRSKLVAEIAAGRQRLTDLCARLVRIRSENPPGDTRDIASVIAGVLRNIPGVVVEELMPHEPIANIVARVHGAGPGRRLVFNGHLDTYPIGERSDWTVDPFGAEQRDGRMYGRGVSDMKAGIASSIFALERMASCRDTWNGEVVLTLAGDEETMGTRGTAFLLDHVPHARGDAMICGDVGSPRVLRFGEKGFIWLDVEASGKAAHGAHVHKGVNAIDRLIAAVRTLQGLREREVTPPPTVADAMRDARGVSEALSGEGETATLQAITVNCGVFQAGISPNLIPARAEARFDIRLPVGVTAAEIETEISALLRPLEGVRYRIARSVDPTWTDPQHEVIRLLQQSGSEVLGERPVVNMRVGASDARLYRLRGLPAIVCGLTPYNLGGPDEYIVLDDLYAVAYMHTLTAFDFLVQGFVA
jgi:succinyl-diaminopimelate desuccinylase